MQISNNDNVSVVVIVHLAYYIHPLLLPPLSRLVHTVIKKKHQIRNLRACVRVRCAVTIVSKWPPRSLTITDARPHIDAWHDKLCMHIYATNADARTYVRARIRTYVGVSRHGAVCQQWLISICIPEFRLDPET